MAEQFEHESLQSNQSIGAYLKALTEGFEKGRITLNSEDKQIELYPNNLLKFTIKVRKKNDETKLSIKIVWKDGKSSKKEKELIVIGS